MSYVSSLLYWYIGRILSVVVVAFLVEECDYHAYQHE